MLLAQLGLNHVKLKLDTSESQCGVPTVDNLCSMTQPCTGQYLHMLMFSVFVRPINYPDCFIVHNGCAVFHDFYSAR